MKRFISLLLSVFLTVSLVSNGATVAAQTRDNWRSVRTNNLHVIGNADPEKLRQVAAWLEFFNSAFARSFSANFLAAPVPTTVIRFRAEPRFTPFKPLNQARPATAAAYFHPGN